MEEIIDLLIRLREYMDNKADVADYDYATGRYTANTEMKFYIEIDDVLKKIKTIKL